MARNRRKRQFTTWKRVVLLVFLLVILGGLITANVAKNEYEQARQESLSELEDSGRSPSDDEDIEFNSSDDSLDYINVLLVGLDDEEGYARTDTIMLAQYHPSKGEARLVSFMRDMYVSIPGYRDNKINTSYALGGLELLRETIDENFDIDIHYYAQVDFNGFTRIVDTLSPEGIEVDVERRMFYQDGAGTLTINFAEGLQTMDGNDALKYVRFRNDHENDFGRVRRQQQVMTILKDELMSISGVRRIPQILGSIEPFIQTNISNQKLISYGRDFFLNSVDDIETMTLPIEDGYRNEFYSHAGAVLELDKEKNKQALQNFLLTSLESESELAENNTDKPSNTPSNDS
ncbi:LCP family protein [Bacillus shivajii]|uniref:LCP family protein n=1 Tax=Bacillus shivajii TaxID=1983719 RepID=UPI001CFB7135|nr:LCP family protein [Bacillus shivajii]UCZ51967.1 LCP family protein [Bacillus shivajii]